MNDSSQVWKINTLSDRFLRNVQNSYLRSHLTMAYPTIMWSFSRVVSGRSSVGPSRSLVEVSWTCFFGSGRSPMNRRMIHHTVSEALRENHRSRRVKITEDHQDFYKVMNYDSWRAAPEHLLHLHDKAGAAEVSGGCGWVWLHPGSTWRQIWRRSIHPGHHLRWDAHLPWGGHRCRFPPWPSFSHQGSDSRNMQSLAHKKIILKNV